jgi:hypothetical protein
MTTRSVWAWALGSIAILSIALAACSTGAALTAAPTGRAAPVSAAPTASIAAPAIPDGTYVGPTQQVADLIALIDATNLTAAQKTDLIDNALAIKGHATYAVSLDLHGGQYAQGQIVDGGTIEVGSRGTYAFPDRHTLLMEESGGASTNTFEVTSTATGFTLRRTSQAGDAVDVMITKIFWESGPFTPVP